MRSACRHTLLTAFAFAAALACPAHALSQEAIGSLKGHVLDTGDRGLAGVEVTVRSSTLVGPLTTTTMDSGEFRFVALPPGPYVVSFSRSGLVTVKLTMKLSLAEAATVRIVMHQRNGDDGAITVSEEIQVFPPSWATSVTSRSSSLERLPVTGTVRSIVGLTTELPARAGQALFLIDGLPLRHGWQLPSWGSFAGPGAETLYELTVSPGRLTPGYGRLESSAVEAVTVRGANGLAGSVKAGLDGADMNADLLREARPANGMAGSAEYTLGGALQRNRSWFFASGRNLRQTVNDRAVGTGETFETSTRERIGLARLTFAPAAEHRFEGQWIGAEQRATGAAEPVTSIVADAGALSTRTLADRVFSAGYVGRVSRRLDVSARYTHERGSTSWTDSNGSTRTSLIDQQTGAVWGAPLACFGCDPRTLTHRTFRATASTSLATHDITFGYDTTSSSLAPESDPNGDRFQIRATRSSVVNGVVYPVIEPGSTWIVWTPDFDRRRNVRTDAVFVNDRWMPNGRLSVDVGLRLDRNRSSLAADGSTVLSERGLSPRLFANWRLSDRLPWTLTAGFGRYATGAAERELEHALGTWTRAFLYQGPFINSVGPVTGPAESIDRVFNWFGSTSGTALRPAFTLEPSLSTDTISPPHVDEWSFGVSRVFRTDGHARIDLTRRTYADFPGREISLGSPGVDRFGRAVDSATAAPSTLLERTYTGMTLKAEYRFGHWAHIDAQYTLSKLSGNSPDAPISGSLAGTDLAYPDYFQPSWRLPVGSLPDDARHRLRMWAHSEVLANDVLGLVVVTLVHSRESGRPYGAAALVGVEPFVANPGFVNPPPAVLYYFTARDAFRTEAIARTDMGVTYSRRLPGTIRGELFAAFHILNLANTTAVFHPERLVVVKTAYTDPSLQRFNPFTESPSEGVHWTMDDANAHRGTARDAVTTTLPRTFRFTFGIRF